ncbi:hypothetical protein HRQ91_03750 [Treponema parvum]|uniref:Transglutaminase-like domain-containing protein n=1 Tax=Treponema parvum TaxID=138851 RepID=A0A975F3C4_9SPIR|nr:hypothetical protein [Treponema parvum]QTQ13642.1 hypothetical protein HRQ91_03750 [Treponema parvum]
MTTLTIPSRSEHRKIKNTGRPFILHAAFFVALLFFPHKAQADFFYSEKYGYYLDLPEAYRIEDQAEDESSIFFTHSLLPVYFAIKIYEADAAKTSVSVLRDALDRLKSENEISEVKWNGSDCALADFSFAMPDKTQHKGWAACIPVGKGNAVACLLCYAPLQRNAQCSGLIISTIDSFVPSRAGFLNQGLIETFAFPYGKKKELTLNIGGKTIATRVDEQDAEAAKFVVEREYAVLTLYARHNLWKEAWQRYYRFVFRDSFSRLSAVSADIYKEIFSDAIKADINSPERVYAQTLLSWLQDFTYERNHKTSDFTDLISALSGAGSDCDSRSLLLCVLMKHIGVNSALFISREYSHAVAGLNITGDGAKIKVGQTDFLIAETTAHVDIGKIAKDMSDKNKWIAVEFP